MKILQRYVFRELLLPFVLALVTLTFIFMAVHLVRAVDFIIGRGVPLEDTLYVLFLIMQRTLGYTVPMSLLAAVMIVFGNLSQHSEIRAIKASGVHIYHIMIPAFLIGLLLSFLIFIFNDQVANNAGFELRKTTKKLLIKHPRAAIEPGRFVSLGDNIKFLTKEMNGNTMRDITAYEIGESEKPTRTIIAESGEILTDPVSASVQIRLYNGSISDSQDEGIQSIQFKTYEFPSFGQEDIRKMRKKKKDYSLAEILVELQQRDLSREDLAELWTAFHHRIAFAFGSFIFVLLGVPIAVLVRRGEIVLSFAISFMTAVFYYILYVGAQTISLRGALPAWLALWLPNILLLGIGGYLLRRSFRN